MNDSTAKTNTPDTIESTPDLLTAPSMEEASDYTVELTGADALPTDEEMPDPIAAFADEAAQDLISELDETDDEEEADRIIELTDEDGLPVLFEVLDLIEYQGETYAVLLPAEDSDQDSGEVEILRITEDETEEDLERYEGVEDEDILNAVFQIFQERFSDQFDFE